MSLRGKIMIRKRTNKEKEVFVWHEPDKKGGYLIYAGIPNSDVKTYAGSAMSKETLDYNIRKAKRKFQVKL